MKGASTFKIESVISHKIHHDGAHWLTASVPDDIPDYYRCSINRIWGKKLTLPLHGGHVTIFNGKYEKAAKHELAFFHNKKVTFTYSGPPLNHSRYGNGKYWWVRLSEFSELSSVRISLGLKPIPFHPFHITVGYDNS